MIIFFLQIHGMSSECMSIMEGLHEVSDPYGYKELFCESFRDAVVRVTFCTFVDFKMSALLVYSRDTSLSIYDSSFLRCANWCNCRRGQVEYLQPGGGVFAILGECDIQRSTGTNCEAEMGLFLFVDASGVQNVIDCRAVMCMGQNDIWGQDTFRFMGGNQTLCGINSTYNRVLEDGSGIETSWAYTLKIQFSTFLSNRGDSTISIFSDENTYLHENMFVNVCNNTVYTMSLVVVSNCVNLSNWIFKGNTDAPIFGVDPYLDGYVYEYNMITVVDCIFDTFNFGFHVYITEINCSQMINPETHSFCGCTPLPTKAFTEFCDYSRRKHKKYKKLLFSQSFIFVCRETQSLERNI